MDQMQLTPGSSNVYGYYFEFESPTTGILYVKFLADYRAVKTSGPGTTYAYYTVSARKYHQFQESAAASAGNAVWDFQRIRGTIWGHRYQYRLIQSHGDYVPRKATKKGYRTRAGRGRRGSRPPILSPIDAARAIVPRRRGGSGTSGPWRTRSRGPGPRAGRTPYSVDRVPRTGENSRSHPAHAGPTCDKQVHRR